ncbi:hypothetical protein [Aneurinibacillus tyrosinisolvens]|uniref:hypothetical protein n=1 Tax=Aneurinibacillus tyrosinisolvens TaxID=1443435 RepID=UPI00063F2116|nr:hypothetical protein [Aneurinibacillus tyrosinisolvens]
MENKYQVVGNIEVAYTMDVKSADVVQTLINAKDMFRTEKVKEVLLRVTGGKQHMDLTSENFDIEIKAEENWHIIEDEVTVYGKVTAQVTIEIESHSAELVNEILQGWLSDSFDEEKLYLYLENGGILELSVWDTNISWSDAEQTQDVA